MGKQIKSGSSDNPFRKTNGKKGLRSKSTIMRLNMYNSGKPIRDKAGKVIGGSLMMGDKAGGQPLPKHARIAPDRRWFGNTRTISPEDLDKFRENMRVKQADPFSVVLRQKKIPMSLLKESAENVAKFSVTDTESYSNVFGSKKTRKKPKLNDSLSDIGTFLKASEEKYKNYVNEDDISNDSDDVKEKKEEIFSKGQSKRIWGELYKVLDSSDVILQVIDARNVPGTRCYHVEKHIKKNAPHKQMVIVVNKCDLVPTWVTKKWVKILSESFPTLAFHASITNSFGKGSLISLLRQFGKLHSDKRQISVGVIGYPNTGKSSIINTLMGTKCCKAAPIPGETKIWQYVTLMKRIFLIDCPGVVYNVGDDEVETVLKGVVRAEKLDTPSDFIAAVLDRVKPEYITRQYQVDNWTDSIDFLNKVALRSGKLLKGGEPDIHSISINVINDWQRGKLPYFVPPPNSSSNDIEDNVPLIEEGLDEIDDDGNINEVEMSADSNEIQ